jgi:glycosyltransferase involved in cell wall biosynthesis
MKYKYTFTIITCTINKFEKLIRLIKSLKNQSYRNFELIIIDQSNEDKIKELQKYKIPIKYIKKKEKGLSRSRNLGIKLSKGKYLLFTDDDCYFNVNFLYQMKDAYKRYRTDLIGFPIFNKNQFKEIHIFYSSNPLISSVFLWFPLFSSVLFIFYFFLHFQS